MICLSDSFSKRFKFLSRACLKSWDNIIFETVILQWVVLAGRVMKMPEQLKKTRAKTRIKNKNVEIPLAARRCRLIRPPPVSA